MRPMAAASAASEPLMQAKNPHPSTVDVPSPDRLAPRVASATSNSLPDSPVRTRMSPVRINNGTAINANESIPSNSASPSRVGGNTSVNNSMANEPTPITTQIRTASKIRTTINISGIKNPHPRMISSCCMRYCCSMGRLLIEKFLALKYRTTGFEVGNIANNGLNQPHQHHGEPERYRRQKPGQTDAQAVGHRTEFD